AECENFAFDSFCQLDESLKELQTEISRILVDRGDPPAWAGPVLLEQLAARKLDTWTTVFAWWSRWKGGVVWNYRERKTIITEAPLPEIVPDHFDESFIHCVSDVIKYEEEQIGHRIEMQKRQGWPASAISESHQTIIQELKLNSFWSSHLSQFLPVVTVPAAVGRLLDVRLTRARATRIARMIKDYPELLGHPRMTAVAELSEPLEADALPPIDAIDLGSAEQVAVYRRLGGVFADACLRERARALISGYLVEMPAYPRAKPHFWRWSWLPAVAGDALLTELRARIREAPLETVVTLFNSAPWLVDERLLHEAAKRQLELGQKWDPSDVPPVLARFVEERARRTEDDGELLSLLQWLEAQGMSRTAVVDLLHARLERRPPSRALLAVATMLTTRSAWEKDGLRLLRALARWKDWGFVGSFWWKLLTALSTAPARSKEGDSVSKMTSNMSTVVSAAHFAFATLLLDLAAEAAGAGDDRLLTTLLTAVLQLDPPPPIVRELRRLGRHTILSERAQERINSGMKLFKSAEGRTATFDGLREATETLRRATARPELIDGALSDSE
ncbi:MAG: hypothetical protein L6Q76_08775, partial [Polyangiaceae bacterium]|nr:hypothetical protein [Polyangiaceae bacterium]